MRAVIKVFVVGVTAAVLLVASTFASATAPEWLNLPSDSQMIVMGGVDDKNAKSHLKRVGNWSPNDDVVAVSYPASFRPHAGDITYDQSVEMGLWVA